MPSADELRLEGTPILQFQPAVDLATGLLLGFEALVRWRHPERGLIGPDVLLPWAMRTGYMPILSSWVLSEACNQAAGWPSGIQLAVNSSVGELREHAASAATAKALKESSLNPDRLTIEVTETTVADEDAAEDLRALATLGVHLAVDDVGTSWSTLENLRRFSITTAKIDREFISGLEPHEGMNRAIVEAIIHVAHSLGISTVAEGVESASQVEILREFGADVAQGYFFAPPLPAEQAHELAVTKPRIRFTLEVAEPIELHPPGPGHDVGADPDSGIEPGDELEISRAHVL